jgi:hypothetical protein
MRIRTRLSSIKENLAVFKFALMGEEMSGGFATMVKKWLAGIRGTDTNGCIYFYYFVPRGHFCRGPLQKTRSTGDVICFTTAGGFKIRTVKSRVKRVLKGQYCKTQEVTWKRNIKRSGVYIRGKEYT